MKRPVAATLVLLGSLLIPLTASAVQIRAYVSDFTVSSPESSDLKATIKRLLNSRLSGNGISTVDAATEADVIVSGSYTQLGKFFSLDAVAKTASGKQLTTAFQQGESTDTLIPAIGKLAATLQGEVAKTYSQSATHTSTSNLIYKPNPIIEVAPAREIIRQDPDYAWTSQRIDGAQKSLAPAGPKEFFITDGNSISLYRKDAKLVLVAQAKVPSRYKVLAVDSLPGDQEGNTLAFVSIMDGEAPASRVYVVANGQFKLVAENLNYLFRSVALNGATKRLYAQEMGRVDDYYGDVYEASYVGGSVKLQNPLKMPKYANIYNFNTFRDQSGKSYMTAFSDSGYLIVYSDKGEEVWRSTDKFGGSETNFQRSDSANERITGSIFRTRFIDQRISVTEKGEIIVPQNNGTSFGNIRSFSKYSIFAFAWNGSSLEERWRTKLSQNYLSDYLYEPGSKELVLLEVVQKEGLFGKGGSALKVIQTK